MAEPHDKRTIASMWATDDADRKEGLDRARYCASLSKPWVLPPDDQNKDGKLPETFTSLITRGCTNLAGRMLLALYPPSVPWFRLKPASKWLYDTNIAPETLQQLQQELMMHELIMLTRLEQADVPSEASNRRKAGFRTRKRMVIDQLLVTGDCLERLTDEYRIQVYRRDQYVTRRDNTGDVVYHIIKESIDPLSLTEKQRELAELKTEELVQKPHSDRMKDMYTHVCWQPLSKVWLVRQEIERKIINESQEKVSQFISTSFELAPGENYGRGWVELNLGDARTYNELQERLLDFAATASKQLFAIDYNSQVRPRDLAKDTGEVFQARVQGGQVQDVSCLKVDKLSDFNVVYQTAQTKRSDLAAAMLMETEVTPRGDRVTATQVNQVAAELQGALGGLFAPIADSQQTPLVERLLHQMRKDALLPSLPPGSIEIEAVTGLPALSREYDQQNLLGVMQVLGQFGPEVMGRINMSTLIDVMFRQANVYHPGLVKSEEDLATEQQAAMQQQMAMAGGEEAIRTGGAVIEQQAKQGDIPNV